MDSPPNTPAEPNAHLVAGELEETFSGLLRESDGKLDEARQTIRDWLGHEDNRLLPEASRVFLVWLRAGGRFAFIRKEVIDWIRAHSLERDAVYLLKYVAKERSLPDDVTLKVLNWCAAYAHDRDAIWRMTSLSAHVSADLFEDAVRASASVLAPMFANPSLPAITRSQVTTVLGNLATLERLASHPQSRELDALLCRWMDHLQSFEPSARHAQYHQNRQFLARLLTAAESEPTTPELTPLIEWVSRWEERAKAESKDLIKRLRLLRHTSTGGRRRRPDQPRLSS